MSAILCLPFAMQTIAATPIIAAKKKSQSKIPATCLTCLNNFSPETLTFTINEKKCPAILARCNKSTSTAKCEDIINDCFEANCNASGSCADEISNRSLAYGCLKAEGIYLPYTCTSYILSLAKNKASEVQTAIETAERAHENALKQQEAKIAAEKAAAEKAAADAKVKAAQAEAEAKAKQAQIEAQNKLDQQKLQAQLEEQAKQAELEREKQAKLEARNNKPNVKYNNILSAVKKDIANAKAHTSKAFNLLGIEKVDSSKQSSAFGGTQQVVTVYGITGNSANAKAKSYINASKYKTTTDYVCTKDTKESFIKSELLNALNILTASRDTLMVSVSELEALNADDEVSGKVSDDKINTLYEVQNKLTETINTIESETNNLKTSCETRCAGVSAFSFAVSETKFDENGLIVEDKSSDNYSCKDFEDSGSTDILSLLGGGTSSFGTNTNQKIADLTKRVTKAVLSADRALVETEIATATGNFSSASNTDYAVINSCLKSMLDTDKYISCITTTLGEQLQILSKYPTEDIQREEYYNTVLREFNKSASVALELLNSQYPDAKCDNPLTTEVIENNVKIKEPIGCCATKGLYYTSIGNLADARACSTYLAQRLKKTKKKDITISGNIRFMCVNNCYDSGINVHDMTQSRIYDFATWLSSKCTNVPDTQINNIKCLTQETQPYWDDYTRHQYDKPTGTCKMVQFTINTNTHTLSLDNISGICEAITKSK